MKQITEDYCCFEVAKLLKEKGFRAVTNRYYNAQYDQIRTVSDSFMMDWNDEEYMKSITMPGAIAIPTHQMALKWLREEKEIYLDVFIDDDSEMPWTYNIHKGLRDGTTECVCHHHGNYYPLRTGYEEAVEAAIKYTLENLI